MKPKEILLAAGWSIKLAFKIDAKILIIWSSISAALAVLPAVVLYYNRQTISILSNFLLTGQGRFADVLPSALALGIIITIRGISILQLLLLI